MRYAVMNNQTKGLIRDFCTDKPELFSSRAKAQKCADEFFQSAIARHKGYTYSVLPENVALNTADLSRP